MSLRKTLLAAPGGLLLAVLPGTAGAHIGFAANDLYAGMLNPILHLSSLLPLIALALWFCRRRESGLGPLVVAYLTAGITGIIFGRIHPGSPDAGLFLLWLALLIGLLVAIDRDVPAWLALPVAAMTGLAEGFDNTAPVLAELTDPLLYTSGLLLAMGLVPLHLVGLLHGRQKLWISTAIRIVGSWIATASALVLTLKWAATSGTVNP